jgi:hypothetical protein
MSDDMEEFFDRVGTGHIDNKTDIAIIDFMAYLTTRQTEIRVGAAYNPSPLLDYYKAWKESRGKGENTCTRFITDANDMFS